MKGRWLRLALVFGLGCGAVFAHGSKVHVRGTIEKISADSLQVKAQDGKTVEVKLAASTVYLLHTKEAVLSPEKAGGRTLGEPDKPAKLADLAVGDLVVIHATPKGDTLEAVEVKFSVPAKPKS